MTSPLRVEVSLDAAQASVVATVGPCIVLGGPGTGKTATVVGWAASRLPAAAEPGRGVAVLVPSRRGAARLRDLLSRRVAATTRDPAVRTPHSLAWAVLRESAVRSGERPPRLLTGAEADISLADLLAGHEAGDGGAPAWPDSMPAQVRSLRAFRTDLRELWGRLVERGHGPAHLAQLGRDHGRPEWVAAAQVFDERLRVIGLSGDNAWDPAEIIDEAAARLQADQGLRAWARDRVTGLAVDDAQDLTAAGWRLVAEFGGGGTDLLLAGDPDLATQTFRGASPAGFTDLAERFRVPSGDPAPVVVLRTQWRSPAVLAGVHAAVRERIGVVTAVHRRPVPVRPGGTRRVVIYGDATLEAAGVAGVLRGWRHDTDQPVAWRRMAVIVRSLRRAETIRRAAAQLGVPVTVPGPGAPLRDQPVVRMLLRAAAAAMDPDLIDAAVLRELACGPIGGSDSLRWQRLVRAARPASAGRQPADDLAAELRARLTSTGQAPAPAGGMSWSGVGPRHARPLEQLAGVLAAARTQLVGGDQPEAVLWALWDATGLSRRWRRTALGGGPDAAAADDDLDAVTALFEAAGRFAQRHPGSGMAGFGAHIGSLGVADDRLGGDEAGDAVTVTTPAGAAGLEWDAVVVAGVQEAVWPDLRVRGSVLRNAELVDLLDGRDGLAAADQVRQTLDDELRLFHVAVTRASHHLVVTAVNGDDERPSELCRLVAGPDADLSGQELQAPPSWHDHTLSSVVVALRRLIGAGAAAPAAAGLPPAPSPEDAARMLARLVAGGVPGADPATWWWAAAPGGDPDPGTAADPDPGTEGDPDPGTEGDPCPGDDGGPTTAGGAADRVPVTISPSAVETFATCPLRAYLSRMAGNTGDQAVRLLGDLIHAAAERHPQGTVAELQAHVDAGWTELGVPPGWMDERLRRKAAVMVQRLADWMTGRAAPVVTEARFRMDVGGVTVAGTIDRLDHADPVRSDAVQVVDFKTGNPNTKEAARENPQLALYQLAVDRGLVGSGHRSAGAALVHVGGTARQAAVREQGRLSEADTVRVAGLVRAYADAVVTGTFEATPGTHCERCPVRTSCPADPGGTHPLSLRATQ